MKRIFSVLLSLAFVTAWCGAGAAKEKTDPAAMVKTADQPAYSIDAGQSGLKVAVSPARQTLQILGSSGMILGSGISAIQNAKYRKAIEEALGDYDAGGIFEATITRRLEEVAGDTLARVAPMGGTAGYPSLRDAREAYYTSLEESGNDCLLDMEMDYGVYGYEGALILKVQTHLKKLPSGHTEWKATPMAITAPILADDKLRDPTDRISPNWSSPRLGVDEDAIAKWTRDGGGIIRARFEETAEAVVSALLTEMGFVEEAAGCYQLGKRALYQKNYQEAADWLDKALALDPDCAGAINCLSICYARNKELDKAIELAKKLAEKKAGYGPAAYNLACWYAIEKKAPQKARPWYEKARELGMPRSKKVEKKLGLK
jgi:hypothetical protein